MKEGRLKALERKVPLPWTPLQATHAIIRTWKSVTQTCIANCFAHDGFIKPDILDELTLLLEEYRDEDDDEGDIPHSVIAN